MHIARAGWPKNGNARDLVSIAQAVYRFEVRTQLVYICRGGQLDD